MCEIEKEEALELEERERSREQSNLVREKRIKEFKVKCKVTVAVQIYTIIVATMKICTTLAPLMWVNFWVKCVKLSTFSILEGLMWLLLDWQTFLFIFFTYKQ